MEPPMSPVPITDARGLSSTGTLFGEVISKAAGALQVDVVQLLGRRLDVHQDPYTAGLHPSMSSSRAHNSGMSPKPIWRAAAAGNIE